LSLLPEISKLVVIESDNSVDDVAAGAGVDCDWL